MRTTGIVKWFDRRTGVGVVTLDDGGECVVCLVAQEGEAAAEPPAPEHPPRRTSWRADARSIAEAVRTGTWGDGGRDY